MKGKIITLLLMITSSFCAFSEQENLFNKWENNQFEFTNPGMVPLSSIVPDIADHHIIITVYPETSGKASDALHGTCGWGTFTIYAGESMSCYIHDKGAYFGIGYTNFKNGSSGRISILR